MPAVRLQAASPLCPGPVLASLAAHAVPGGQRFDPATGSFTRLIETGDGPVAVTVRLDRDGVDLETDATGDSLARLERLVRFWFDLDLDTGPVEAALARDRELAPLVAARPGLRVTRTPEAFPSAISAVLGQQVSVARGRQLGAKLLAGFGRPGPAGLTRHPSPAELVALPFERLRSALALTRSRARTVQAVAARFADGFRPGPDSDPAAVREQLLDLYGIGPWTADYLVLRVIGDRDSFPAGDAVLRRALGRVSEREADERARSWAPWRGYAAAHLWAATAYSDPA